MPLQRGVRRPSRFALLALAPALALAGALFGCASSPWEEPPAGGEPRLRVVATTTWHTDLANRIGGEKVDVQGLMEPGVDPHLYTATAGDVETLAEADIAIWNGLELEGKLGRVFERVSQTVPVVAVGEAVPVELRIPIEGSHEFDPHIWFDPEAWAYAARAAAEGLSRVDPENAAFYAENLERFKAEIEATEAEIEAMLAGIPERSRVLVTSHDAFSYFARAFGLEVESIQGKSTAGEATTADIERVAQRVADADLKAVFIESSVPEQTIDAVLASAERRGVETQLGGELFGDALGDPGTPEGTWAGAVRANAETIASGLGGMR